MTNDFKGRVITPSDSDYDAYRTVFYGGIDRRPYIIILAQNSADISGAIALAREKGKPLAVRSGGHSIAGHSVVDGGIVVDLRNMKKFDLDKSGRTVWAQSGLTAGEYTSLADKNGLVTGFGDTGSVGIGGITLSGGIGFLVRKFGLSIDNLLAAEIVTADGKTLIADNGNNPELFWALRGGGGNFGVVTRFKFRLHQLEKCFGGIIIFPADDRTLARFMELAGYAPEELSSIVNVMPALPMPFVPEKYYGKMIIMAMMMYAGDTGEGEKTIAPFRKLAEPIADMLKPMRYPEIFMPEDKTYHPTAIGHTMFMDRLDNIMAGKIISRLENYDAPLRVVQLRVLGGAMSRIDPMATAFAHRHSRILANVAAFYEGEKTRGIRQQWVLETARLLKQGDGGAYSGFLGDEGEDRIRKAYPPRTWKKLTEIKNKYDPENLFKLNQNIAPERR